MPRRADDSDLEPRPRRRRRPERRNSGNKAVAIAFAVVFGLLLLGAAGIGVFVLLRTQSGSLNGGDTRGDRERLAGAWECTFRDPTGRVTMHKVKVITGTTETATWYRADGSVFRVNRVEFTLDARGPNKVFRYFNGWVVDGPGAGQPFPSGEYVYTLEGDTWTEFDPGGPIVWTRRE